MFTKPFSIVTGLKELKKLDLKMVAKKLMEPKPEGQGWTREQVRTAEKWYRRFLELGVRYPHESIVPNLPIDQFWHQHILDTRAYADDCNRIFGEMLHHFPYFGLRGKQDVANRDSAFDRTNELYRLHFGEDCTVMTGFNRPEVPEDCMVSVRGDDGSQKTAKVGMNCNHDGSGTGCGQRCGRKRASAKGATCHSSCRQGCARKRTSPTRTLAAAGMNCGGGGSGTGCRQGCSRGN